MPTIDATEHSLFRDYHQRGKRNEWSSSCPKGGLRGLADSTSGAHARIPSAVPSRRFSRDARVERKRTRLIPTVELPNLPFVGVKPRMLDI